MKKIPLDKRTIISTILIVFVSLGAARLMSIRQKTKQLSLRAELELGSKRDGLLNELLQVRRETNSLNKKLIDKKKESLLQDAIREAAKLTQIELVNLQFGSPTAQESGYFIQPITATVTGNYSKISGFIDRIEKLEFFVQLSSIHCKVEKPLTYDMLYQPPDESEERLLSSELELTAVYVKK